MSLKAGNKLKIALVGCGRISDNHFNAIHTLKSDLELVAVCDANSKAANETSVKYNVKAYSDLDQLLAGEELDLIVLCTPSGIHPHQTIAAAKKKVNIITEKPMATNLEDGKKMVEICRKLNVKLFVVKQNRLSAPIHLLKKAISGNRFKKIHLVNMNIFWTRPQSYYDEGTGWRGTKDLDGGALMNQASHYVDLLDWLFGPISEVHAFTSTSRNIEAEDTASLNLKWKEGTIGSLSVTMLTYPKNLEASITVIGENGTVKIGGTGANKIEEWLFEDIQEYDQSIGSINDPDNKHADSGHTKYYKNVIDVLKNDVKPISDGESGLKSLEIIVGAYLSAENQTVTKLPLNQTKL